MRPFISAGYIRKGTASAHPVGCEYLVAEVIKRVAFDLVGPDPQYSKDAVLWVMQELEDWAEWWGLPVDKLLQRLIELAADAGSVPEEVLEYARARARAS